MKSRCNSCQNNTTSRLSKSKSPPYKLQPPYSTKIKVIKKKYQIKNEPMEQLRRNQRSIKDVQEKYRMFKDHVSHQQRGLLREVSQSKEFIGQLEDQLDQKQVLVRKLNVALKVERQARLTIQVDLVRLKNQINVLRKENEFYRQSEEDFIELQRSEQLRGVEFGLLRQAFTSLKREVVYLHTLLQDV